MYQDKLGPGELTPLHAASPVNVQTGRANDDGALSYVCFYKYSIFCFC